MSNNQFLNKECYFKLKKPLNKMHSCNSQKSNSLTYKELYLGELQK